MVFSNPEVVRRINEQFIPVALKAGMVNNPPGSIEGQLYAEIARSKPAPQGICTLNSDGKVLTWALSFDDESSIPEFLDHVLARYQSDRDARQPVVAQRYMNFPSRPLPDVPDNGSRIAIPAQHRTTERCPADPDFEPGTLVGRIVGRPLDSHGQPIADTIRQEHYMESRFHIPLAQQQQLARAAQHAAGQPFAVPHDFARAVVSQAYLGQLDVNPMGGVPGSQNEHRDWKFTAQQVPATDANHVRLRLQGVSLVEGGQGGKNQFRGDGRMWEHRVELAWNGYIDLQDHRVVRLVLLANGDERLRWGNDRFQLVTESDARHLMAGHPIDLDTPVRYGLLAESVAEE